VQQVSARRTRQAADGKRTSSAHFLWVSATVRGCSFLTLHKYIHAATSLPNLPLRLPLLFLCVDSYILLQGHVRV
jgi:hypothetical protein